MAVPDTRVSTVTVKSATRTTGRDGEDQWKLQLTDSHSKMPWTTYMPYSWDSDVRENQVTRAKFRKGKFNPGKDNQNDGSQPFHYYWEVEEWPCSEQETPQAAPSQGKPSGPASSAPGAYYDQDPKFRPKAELRLTAALEIAAAASISLKISTLEELFAAGMVIAARLAEEDPHAQPAPESGSQPAASARQQPARDDKPKPPRGNGLTAFMDKVKESGFEPKDVADLVGGDVTASSLRKYMERNDMKRASEIIDRLEENALPFSEFMEGDE